MLYVKSGQKVEDTIKKSRFIGVILPCENEREVTANLRQLHDLHPNASHIAFAYRIKTDKGFIIRFNDAGEPGGTAGKPIFQHIEGKDLINVLIAVIRYFGGIKLGAGGLTRAYGNTAKQAVEAAQVSSYVEQVSVKVVLDYKQMQNFDYQLKKLQGVILQQNFAEQVQLLIRLPADNFDALKTATSDCHYRID